jgi:hypothetical protein
MGFDAHQTASRSRRQTRIPMQLPSTTNDCAMKCPAGRRCLLAQALLLAAGIGSANAG